MPVNVPSEPTRALASGNVVPFAPSVTLPWARRLVPAEL